MTTEQVRQKSKTITRRFGWWFLKPGDMVQPVEKAMGLKKGEAIKKIGCPIRVVSVRREPLNFITPEDCVKEGFPMLTPDGFVAMLQCHYQCAGDKQVNRIQFEYVCKEPDRV
jgi:hypothetical protein